MQKMSTESFVQIIVLISNMKMAQSINVLFSIKKLMEKFNDKKCIRVLI